MTRFAAVVPTVAITITKRFLQQAPAHLRPGGVVMMAFSDREPTEHSPDRVAEELGYPVKTLLHAYYGEANNYIFEIRPTTRLAKGETRYLG